MMVSQNTPAAAASLMSEDELAEPHEDHDDKRDLIPAITSPITTFKSPSGRWAPQT